MADERARQPLRPGAGGIVALKIADEIAHLKSGPEWQSGDRHSTSLVKDDALNVMLMVLKKGARLHPHRTKGPVVVQVVSGSIQFSCESEQHLISAGEMVGLDRGVTHSVEALAESALLLTTSIE